MSVPAKRRNYSRVNEVFSQVPTGISQHRFGYRGSPATNGGRSPDVCAEHFFPVQMGCRTNIPSLPRDTNRANQGRDTGSKSSLQISVYHSMLSRVSASETCRENDLVVFFPRLRIGRVRRYGTSTQAALISPW
jgi:hypothetical protein